jgi:small subunit ribosomal protein S8
MTSDPISDMLTRIRNAGKAKFSSVDIPSSKILNEIARVLKETGFVKNYKYIQDDKQGALRVYLKYTASNEHVIGGLKRGSKPSRRIYVKSKDVKPFLSGMGISILSTSNGILTDRQARAQNVGGELICNIW